MIAMALVSCSEDDSNASVVEESDVINESSFLSGYLNVLASNNTDMQTIIDNYSCFNIMLPVEVLANGQQILISTEADYAQVETVFNQNNFDDDTLEFIYPINVIDSDYEVIPVADSMQLNALALDCANQGAQGILDCISLNYPVTLQALNANMEIENTIVLNSDEELSAFITGLPVNANYAIQFPLSITGYDGEEIVVNSNTGLLATLQSSAADCEANSCNSSTTIFKNAYQAIYNMPNVEQAFTMDTWTHEYTFSLSQTGTICSIGYKAEYQPTPILYLIEILDSENNVLYSGNHSFSTTMMGYVSIPAVPVVAFEQYTIRRSIESYDVGMGVGTVLHRSQNTGAQTALLPTTQGSIIIHQSRFYGGGGSLDPDLYSVPMIDFVFKPNN